MRKSNGPRYFDSKGAWYANYNNQRTLLVKGDEAETRAEAFEKYGQLIAATRVEEAGDNAETWTILNAWLNWQSTRLYPRAVSANTYRLSKMFAESFSGYAGTVSLKDLRRKHFEGWLATMSEPNRVHKQKKYKLVWGVSTKKLAIGKLRAAFNWAATESGITRYNPFKELPELKRLWTGKISYKGVRPTIEEHEHETIVKDAQRRAHSDFVNLLMLLHGTGARPAEIHHAKAKEWNEELKAFVIQDDPENIGRFKQMRYGEVRTVYIAEALVPIARDQMRKYPTGPIFRNERGQDWTPDGVAARFLDVVKRLGLKRKGLALYSYRHAFVTRWITKGGNIVLLAELLGTSTNMIKDHYSHLFAQHATLRQGLEAYG